MFRIPVLVVSLLLPAYLMAADPHKLAAPSGWGGETIKLPPGFARDMKWKGVEHIRFAPGMFKPESDSFFSYAFVFELQPQADLAQDVIKEEFLKYYRGLCKAVIGSKIGDVDPSAFSLSLKPIREATNDKAERFSGTLEWVEPFSTKEPQQLNLEIQVWKQAEQSFVFACVSPQQTNEEIWQQLRKIRGGYTK